MPAFVPPGSTKPIRCAVYTRKSSEEGLEQSFNSLHAQREACEAYVLSQKHEGWTLVPTAYDDGGFSGGSMERPGLKALMADVENWLVDTVVVYKVDRLTRSLADFAKMVEQFDARSVSFVSVTQAFNTTTSMGRLTLNVLLSFAQFEREVTGERIRDKIAASKAKGMWMGGAIPLGYTSEDRLLTVHEQEAEQVRTLFRLYLETKSVDVTVDKAFALGIRSKERTTIKGKHSGGDMLARGSLYKILANPIYAGEIGHKGKRFKGQHEAIVEPKLFADVQALLETNRRKRQGLGMSGESALLSGLVTDADGNRLTSTHTNKAGKRYRYYANEALRIPANDLEEIVTAALVEHLGAPAKLATLLPDLAALNEAMIAHAKQSARTLKLGHVAERRSCMAQLVERVQVSHAAVHIDLRLAALSAGDALATIVQPTSIGRAKAALSLVVPGKHEPRPDQALIAMVAQARGWLDDLTSGRRTSLSAIAEADGVTPAYVRRTIGSAFLAPDLVTAIVEGRQPAGLTAGNLKALLPLPTDWSAQRAVFATLN